MKKQVIIILTSLFGFIPLLRAQEETTMEEQEYSVLSSDVLSTEVGLIPEVMDSDIDSLLHSWHARFFTRQEEYCHDDEENVYFPDSVYRRRLESLPTLFALPYNKIVRDCIDLYADRRRGLVRYMLGMADFYFPIIEQIFDEQELPLELKYLAVVESALNPVALSRVGATGMWQFMLPTGKGYGLEINSLVDERRDPVRSTYAAAKYLKDMYAIYEDWLLVVAAYNCGPGNVNKALRRANGKTGFWDIFPYLPRETRSYVPLFIAANYIMTFYCDHNLCPVQTDLPLATDTVVLNRMLHFDQVSEILHVDVEQIRALNPQYKRNIIPGSALRPAVLKLPAVDTYAFVDKADTIYTHRAEELLAIYSVVSADNPSSARREKITHVAASGENLYTIADKYGVTARNIRLWNGLGSNRVAKGKRLTVYIDNGGLSYAAKKPAATQDGTASTAQGTTGQETEDGFATYIVQSGDSLYTISKKYPGTTAAALQKANNLASSRIRPGQVLKIPVG